MENERERFLARLRDYFPTEEEMLAWMDTPNKSFRDKRPNELFDQNESGELWKMLDQMDDNVAN
jgi:uncharacterized protein (DUF2384 family)